MDLGYVPRPGLIPYPHPCRVLSDPAYQARSSDVSKVLQIRPVAPALQAAEMIEEGIMAALTRGVFRSASLQENSESGLKEEKLSSSTISGTQSCSHTGIM